MRLAASHSAAAADASLRAEFLEAARLAGAWLVNSQNTVERPWGAVNPRDSADLGRFLEKACPSRAYILPAPVWLTGAYLSGLAALAGSPVLDRQLYVRAGELGLRHLTSLQCFDCRWPGGQGGFHERFPGDTLSYPRDAATAALGLLAWHERTQDADCLARAIAFGTWYASHGVDAEGYPWCDYALDRGVGSSPRRGDWQAGGALVFFQLLRLTGEEHWRTALVRVLAVLARIYADDPGGDTAYDFHGDCTVSVGNDDFATTALLAGYAATGEQRHLDLAAARLRAAVALQDARGAFPGYGGTFVAALELHEALACVRRGWRILPEAELAAPLERAARFSLGLQERSSPDRWLLGGVYGQGNYAHARDVVHGRDTAYALQLWLRLAGIPVAAYSTDFPSGGAACAHP